MSSNVWLKSGKVYNLTPSSGGATTTGAQSAIYKDSPYSAFQIGVTGTGSISTTVLIECSLDGTNWCSTPLASVSLSGTTSATDGFTTQSPWKFIRANVTAISGTGATVTVLMGV